MAWEKGPLPKDTYGWGGVVPIGEPMSGFYFADFCGDHVKIDTGGAGETILKAHEVAVYDNSLQLPPDGIARANGAKPS